MMEIDMTHDIGAIIGALEQYTRGDDHQRAIDAAVEVLRAVESRESALIADYQRLMDKHNAPHVNAQAVRVERDALRDALVRIIAVDDAHATIHAPDGDDVARMIEWAEAFDAARALSAPAVEGV